MHRSLSNDAFIILVPDYPLSVSDIDEQVNIYRYTLVCLIKTDVDNDDGNFDLLHISYLMDMTI
jgi:hypothetical protein